MAGDQSIANSAQDVRTKIGEFAAKLRDIHDELGGRIDELASTGSGLWIGNTPPTDLTAYSGWVNTSNEDVDLLYNAGTIQTPVWTSILARTNRPGTFGVPYKTTETIGGRVVWAVDMSLGNLPNATIKLVSIPPEVLSSWGTVSERWLDLSNCYAYEAGSGTVLPLPYSLIVESEPDVPTWDKDSVYLENDYVIRQGRAYQAKWYTENDKPENNSGQYDVWTDLGPVDSANIPMRRGTNDTSELFLKNSFVHVRTTSNRTGYQGVVCIKYLKAS
jgi:hypothetical protein